jgi:hypothetical protein
MRTDNSTACGIANKTVKQQRSKSIDMRFYWLCDRVKQGQFKIFWAPGSVNLANFYTKHHSPAHHKRLCPIYLNTATSPSSLQGCVELLARRGPRPCRPAHNQTGLERRQGTKHIVSQKHDSPHEPVTNGFMLSAAAATSTATAPTTATTSAIKAATISSAATASSSSSPSEKATAMVS